MKTSCHSVLLLIVAFLFGGCGNPETRSGVQLLKPHPGIRDIHPIVAPHLSANPVILEGGAYNGENSVRLAQLWPTSTIYCFEPVPQLFDRVKSRTAGYRNIHPYGLALSDKLGIAKFYVSELKGKPGVVSQSGSLLAPKEHLKKAPYVLFKQTIDVPTVTIDSWAATNNVSKVDFLYLDIQGAEMSAMKGAPAIMKTVKVIATEVEFVEAYSGQALYGGLRAWIEAKGFEMIAADFDAAKPVRNGQALENGKWFGDAVFVRK